MLYSPTCRVNIITTIIIITASERELLLSPQYMSGTFQIILPLLIISSHKQPHEVSNVIIGRQRYQIKEKLNNFDEVTCETKINIQVPSLQNPYWFFIALQDQIMSIVHYSPEESGLYLPQLYTHFCLLSEHSVQKENIYGHMAEVFVWLHNLGLKTVYKYLRILPLNVFQTTAAHVPVTGLVHTGVNKQCHCKQEVGGIRRGSG